MNYFLVILISQTGLRIERIKDKMADIIAEAVGLEPGSATDVVLRRMCSAEVLLAPLTDAFTAEDRCRLALEHCEAESIVNFYRMYFCTMQANNWLFYPAGVSDYFFNT